MVPATQAETAANNPTRQQLEEANRKAAASTVPAAEAETSQRAARSRPIQKQAAGSRRQHDGSSRRAESAHGIDPHARQLQEAKNKVAAASTLATPVRQLRQSKWTGCKKNSAR